MIQKPKGTKDLLPQEAYKWQYIENTIQNLFENYGYKEIRVPVLNTQNYFKEEWETQQMLYKKKCTHLKIKVEEVLL